MELNIHDGRSTITQESKSGIKRRVVAMTGSTGCGKSSFIENLIKVDAEVSDHLVLATYDEMGNLAISNTEASDPDEGHGRTAHHYAPERRHQSSVPFSNTADNFGSQLYCPMSYDYCLVSNHEGVDLPNDRMRHFRCPDEDDMISVHSNGLESLFDYSSSKSDSMTTVDSSAVQQGITYTNIEHMLAVLKVERGKCLGELQRFDAALETIDQLANRKLPGSKICFNGSTHGLPSYHLPEAGINVGTALKNKRKERDLPDAAQPAISGPPEHMGTNSPADRKNDSRTTAITPATAAASAAITTTYDQNSLISESKTKEPKICKSCPKTVKDTPALKRHCSEVHKQDVDGNPISVELFPCHITTCRKHTEPFKRREKLVNHIRTFHAEIIEEQEVNGGVISGERDAALTTNNTAEAASDFRGNREAARVSVRAYHDSAGVSVSYPTVLEELLSLPIEVQSAPIAKDCEMAPNIPVDANFQSGSTSEKCSGDAAKHFLDSAPFYSFWDSPLEVDMNRTIEDAAEIPSLAQMLNGGSLDLNGIIDPGLMPCLPSGGKLPNQYSPSALEFRSDFFQQIATEGWPVTVDKTVTVQYDTIDEAKQALLDARKKTLQKLQFINQQIESLEGKKQNRNEAVGGLESVKDSFF